MLFCFDNDIDTKVETHRNIPLSFLVQIVGRLYLPLQIL
jgi:hypothetical protein